MSDLKPKARRLCLSVAAAVGCVLLGGCSTVHPPEISNSELEQAETFPYYPVYWVGRSFGSQPLTAADGQKSYNAAIGDSVYYGDCTKNGSILASGSCTLPLQVTTVIYQVHSNATLGRQRNTVIRGVPATIYEEGRAIELYSGTLAIDVFSNAPSKALLAASELRPLNAPGSGFTTLPLPVFCPQLSGPVPSTVSIVMEHLPGRACQRAAALKNATD